MLMDHIKRMTRHLFLWMLLVIADSVAQPNFWQRTNGPILGDIIEALAINSNGNIFAATDRHGIFRTLDNGKTWESINFGLTDTTFISLAINRQGDIFAGSYRNGIFKSTNNGDSWQSVLKNLRVWTLTINANEIIFAGTDGGNVYRSIDNGAKWDSLNIGVNNNTIFSLAINASGRIFAGAYGRGVFGSIDTGSNWTSLPLDSLDARVVSLVINSTGHIFAGTYGGGIFRSIDDGNRWKPVNTGLTNKFILPLAMNLSGHIFAGTNGVGIFRSKDNGNSWMAVNTGLTDLDVRSLAFNPSGDIFAGTRGDGVFRSTKSTTYPDSLLLDHTVNYPFLPNASNYKATDYRMVGLPGASNRLVNEFLMGQQNKDWQVFRDNGASKDFFVEFDNTSDFLFSNGRAFWIITKGPLKIENKIVPSAPLNDDRKIEILLRSGWNLITNPFTATIAWSKIQSENSISETIYTYGSNGFNTSSSFEPYVGYYYFETRTNPPSLKISYALYFSSTPAVEVDPAIWRVNIAFASGEFSDKSTSFGITNEASPDLDRFDFRKPRAIAATPTVEFKRPQWDANYSTFATDIRPEIETAESWEFDVRAISRQPAQLTFAGISKIPRQFEVYLLDADHAQSVNLREDSLYHFTPAAELMKFKVVVGRKEKVQEQLSSLALPKDFALGPNYPNPFNPSTNIPVAVPVTSEIRLKIYNLLGAEVKTIYDGSIEAGRYWFNWDGRNELGENVATGVYLYRLSTSQRATLLGKMILMR